MAIFDKIDFSGLKYPPEVLVEQSKEVLADLKNAKSPIRY